MERKAPLRPIFWNKNAPKAPNGGVSRVGYQLVRMRPLCEFDVVISLT